MTSFYMFRLYALTFLGKFRGTHEQEHHLHESPLAMTIPLLVLAALSVVGGFIGVPEVFKVDSHWLEHFLSPIFEQSAALTESHHLSHSTEYTMIGTSTALILVTIIFAWKKFSNYVPNEGENEGFNKLLANKWYVDELYNSIIVKPIELFSGLLKNVIEKNVIDGAVNGVGKLVVASSRQLRLIQNGQVGSYILIMVVFIIVFLFAWINDLTIVRFFNKLF